VSSETGPLRLGQAAAVERRSLPRLPQPAGARTRWRHLLRELAPPVRPEPRRRRWAVSARRVSAAVGVAAVTAGLVVFGPAAAAVLGVYAVATTRLAQRARTRRAESAARRSAVDAVATLATELRAGQPVDAALAGADPWLTGPRVVGADARVVAERVRSAVSLAALSGAPLADVLDRLDVHLRAVERMRSSASAQAAGARASALLLAGMPIAGVGLGYLVGVDPLRLLLHTPFGLVCLTGTVGLQLAGLAWAVRLARVEVPA
jgi:tight adherence protein B